MLGTKDQVIKYLEKDKEGDIYEIKRKQEKTVRSLAQNRYYWKYVVGTISDWNGDTVIAVHEMIKTMFKLDSTTDLSTSEFKWMIDQIIEMFASYEVIIPLPKDIKAEESLMKSLGF